jgi:hypothetical protein
MSGNRSAAAAAGGETKRNNYLVFAETIWPYVEAALASGKSTHTEIANYLNSRRVRTHLGRRWNLSSVRFLRDALEGSQP